MVGNAGCHRMGLLLTLRFIVSGCIHQIARKGKFAPTIFSHSKPPRDSTLKGTVNIKFIQEVTVNLNLALCR